MPTVYNGIGTWYWGRSNVHHCADFCSFCGAYGHLKSYNTTTFFVFVFVPLIPLGRKRIMDQCPTCGRHHAIPFRKWEQDRQDQLLPAVSEYLDAPRDAEKATTAISLSAAFDDEDSLLAVATIAEESLGDHAEVQAALGQGYWRFGLTDGAIEAYERSLAINHDPLVGDRLAIALMHQSKPSEAEAYLRHIIDESLEDRGAIIKLLLQSYQSVGDHESVMRLISDIEQPLPSLAKDPDVVKAGKYSSRRQGGGRPIRMPHLSEPGVTDRDGDKWRELLPRLIGPLVAVLAIIGFVLASQNEAKNREVWVVNGLDRAYEVNIASQPINIPPNSSRKVKTGEGDLLVRVNNDSDLPTQEKTFSIQTSLLSRLFTHETFVINMDQAAILVWQNVTYAVNPDPNDTGEVELHVGEPYYKFTGVDFEFEELPDEVELPSQSSSTNKQGLTILEAIDLQSRILTVHLYTDDQTTNNLVRQWLSCNSYEDECLDWMLASNDISPDDLAVLEKRLDDRPINVKWHQAYQAATKALKPEHDLAGQYRGYTSADQENGDLLYLLGAALEEDGEKVKAYEQALNAKQPSPWAAYGLHQLAMKQGRYDDAKEYAEKAVAGNSDESTFMDALRSAYLATRDYANLLRRLIVPMLKEEPTNFYARNAQVKYLAAQGRHRKAEEAIAEFTTAITGHEDWTVADHAWALNSLHATLAYTKGDMKQFDKLTQKLGEDAVPFQGAFAVGDLGRAAKAIKSEEAAYDWIDWTKHSLMYAATNLQKQSDESKHHLDQIIVGIGEMENQKLNELVDLLKSDKTPDMEAVEGLALEPEQMRYAAVVLGVRFPQIREQCFVLAKRYNYDPEFPHHFIEKLNPQSIP